MNKPFDKCIKCEENLVFKKQNRIIFEKNKKLANLDYEVLSCEKCNTYLLTPELIDLFDLIRSTKKFKFTL